MIYNAVGIVIGLSMIFFNNHAVAFFLLLYPLSGLIFIRFSNGLIKFLSNRKRSIYPSVMPGFFTPAIILLFKSIIEYDIFSYQNIWLIVVAVSAIIFFFLYAIGLNKTVEAFKGQIVFMLIMAVIYGYGSTVEANCVFDNSKLQVYRATVLDHRIETGKNNTYYFTLSAWGPRHEEREVEVRRWLYHEIPVGGTVKVNFKNGLLNIPWFTVSD